MAKFLPQLADFIVQVGIMAGYDRKGTDSIDLIQSDQGLPDRSHTQAAAHNQYIRIGCSRSSSLPVQLLKGPADGNARYDNAPAVNALAHEQVFQRRCGNTVQVHLRIDP